MKPLSQDELRGRVEKIMQDRELSNNRYIVSKGASPDDFADIEERALCIAIDMSTIRKYSTTPKAFFKRCTRYFKNRPKMMEPGFKNPKSQASKITMLTIVGEIVHSACETAEVDPENVGISISKKGEVKLDIDKSKVMRNRCNAIHTIVDMKLEERGFNTVSSIVVEDDKVTRIKDKDGNIHDISDYDIDDFLVGEA